MDPLNQPNNSLDYQMSEVAEHLQLLADSYGKLVGAQLNDDPTTVSLDRAGFALVSHGTEADPIFNYANRTALHLFEMSWDAFTRMPSRKSAMDIDQEERQRLLDAVSQKGYYAGYKGMRISATGQRFEIRDAIIWNVIDAQGNYCGQAAKINTWYMHD